MDRTRIHPAHSHVIDFGIASRWLLCVVNIIFILFSPPAQIALARPLDRPPAILDDSLKIRQPAGVSDGALAWGDYNNDGQMDLFVTGTTSAGGGKTAILTNHNGSFTEDTSNLEQVQASSINLGDYDNDGFIDLLLTGYLRVEGGSNVIGFAGLYHNEASGDGRTFVLKQTLPNIYSGSGTWGDYNNDGKLDILLAGYTDGAVPFARIYRNTGNFSSDTIFTSTGTPSVTPLGFSASAWADYDKDGYIDFVISGKAADDTPITQIYHNNGNGGFTVINLTGLWDGTVNFLDYNIDGYPDLLVTGNTGTNVTPNIFPTTILYRNNYSNGTFVVETNSGLPDIWNSSISVGDYNNDGYPDIALAGKALADQPVPLPNQVYTNNKDGSFTNTNAGLPDGAGHILAWGDYNGDNILDLALTGVSVTDPGTGIETYYTYIYPNTPIPNGNTAPSAPAMQAACWDGGNNLILSWSVATDTPGPVSTLTYNVNVGTTQNSQDILSAASDLSSGFHRLPGMGNALTGTSTILKNLPNGTYYWSVQAIDAAYAGGPFDNTPGRVINLGTHVAIDDGYSVYDNEQDVSLNVLSNDAGGSSPLTIFSYTNPSHGVLTRSNNTLLYTPNQPYEGNDSFTYYAIRDDTLYCSKGTVNITVSQHNDPPTNISLSNTQVPDGSPFGTLVGRLNTSDPDANQSFTYTLINGTGYDSSAFFIIDNLLYTATQVNITTKNSYLIRIRSTDQGNLYIEEDFTITVVANHYPTDISLNPTSILEHQAIGTIVGSLSTTDPDSGDTNFLYFLVPDPDNTANNYDNDKFFIAVGGTKLRTYFDFDYNNQQTYQVRIRSFDRGGLSIDKIFTIHILPTLPSLFWLDTLNVQHPSTQPPPPIAMSEDGVNSYNQPDPFLLSVLATDQSLGETLTWSVAQQATHGTATASGTTTTGQQITIGYTPEANWNSEDGRGNDQFTVHVTDSSGNSVELPVQVNVKAVNDPPYIDLVANQNYSLPGRYSITITGIAPGPENENSQPVYIDANCYTWMNCDPKMITNLSVSPHPVLGSNTAVLTLIISPLAKPGNYPVNIVARDNQPYNNTLGRSFTINVTGSWTVYNAYLTLISR